MFTGIVECVGEVQQLIHNKTNNTIIISAPFVEELKVDQSISINGICLTVEKIFEHSFQVTAIEETISKTNINSLQVGSHLNLERCLSYNGRIDGHLVQGHVDTTTKCIDKIDKNGSFSFIFNLKKKYAHLVVEKGSICIDGVSLTLVGVKKKYFSVEIIPYTYDFTTFRSLKVGQKVNIEFDIIGKYLARFRELR